MALAELLPHMMLAAADFDVAPWVDGLLDGLCLTLLIGPLFA